MKKGYISIGVLIGTISIIIGGMGLVLSKVYRTDDKIETVNTDNLKLAGRIVSVETDMINLKESVKEIKIDVKDILKELRMKNNIR